MTCLYPTLHSMIGCTCVPDELAQRRARLAEAAAQDQAHDAAVIAPPVLALQTERALVYHGDSGRIVLPPNSLDAICTDPPAGISFMGREWDDDKGGADQWSAWLAGLLRPWFDALKPGGHGLFWAIPRTSDWTMRALRMCGFEIRDQIHDAFDADSLARLFVDGLNEEQQLAFMRLIESQASPIMMQVFGCVPVETEILTERGWLTHDELVDGDRAVQVNNEGHATLGRVLGVSVFPFDGEMCQIKTRSTLQLLTPGHTVHAYGKHQKWQRIETDTAMVSLPADEFTGEDRDGTVAWQLPLAARGAEHRADLESDDMAALCGWVIAEGHFHKDVDAVSIYQNEGSHADKIRALLDRLGVHRSEYRRTRTNYDDTPRDTVQWYLGTREPMTLRLRSLLAGEKPTPSQDLAWLPTSQALALFEALVDGDGSRSGPACGAWYQKRPEVRAWFQVLCFRLGYRSSENTGKNAVQWSRSDSTEVQRGCHRKRWASRVPYTGDVWCPTVPEGRWVARYQGHVFVTGNTGFPKSLNVSMAIDQALGAERPVIGSKLGSPGYSLAPSQGATVLSDGALGGMGDPAKECEITAPGSPEAAAWEGWGTALKPAVEHWILARKPLESTVARNVLAHGTGGLNIDACRIAGKMDGSWGGANGDSGFYAPGDEIARASSPGGQKHDAGRWPAHLTLAHAEGCALVDSVTDSVPGGGNGQAHNGGRYGAVGTNGARPLVQPYSVARDVYRCVPGCPVAILDQQSGTLHARGNVNQSTGGGGEGPTKLDGAKITTQHHARPELKLAGGASRFFYVAKGSRKEKDEGLDHLPKRTGGEATDREDGSAGLNNPRAGAGRTGGARNHHPCVKSLALMRWLVQLITPPGGVVADPFGGSGSTAVAALELGHRVVLCEREAEYLPIILGRVAHALKKHA